MASDSHQGTMATSTAQPQPAGESSSTAGTASQPLHQQQQPAAEQPKKAKRKRITPEQLEDLVGLFEKTDTPSFEIRESLAKKLGMTNREIQVWFQNRRAKANRVKINEQAALHHQQHLQMQQQQQQQQHLQGHHHPQHPHHHRSNSHNGFGFHPSHVHSAPATPQQQPSPHHHSHPSHASHHHPGSTGSSSAPLAAQDNASFGYFGPNGSSSPPVVMPTPTPRVHSSSSHAHASRRPASLYNIGSYGHHLQTQQFQQQKPLGAFQPQHPSPSGHYGQAAPSHGAHAHGHATHGHAHSSPYLQPASPYGMDIILPASASASSASASSQQRPVLPPPISTLTQSHRPAHHDDYQDSRRVHRHSRTMSDSHPTDYMSPNSVSSVSPPPDRPLDSQYRDEYEDDSPSSATHSSSPFTNGASSSSGGNVNRHSTSLASFGLKQQPAIKTEDHSSFGLKQPVLKTEEQDPTVVLRERQPAHAYYNNAAQAAKNRRSYDDALYDEHQQLMRDNFNMDTRLVISEDEPRPESAIDLLAYAAAYIQESEEHKKDGEEKRDGLGQLSSSNKRQSFHGPTGYPSKEPFQEDRYSSSNMAWEASPPAGSNNDVMPIPRRRGGDDGPYAPRRPRPVTYGGSGFLYDHQENQFMPQSPSSSLLSYGRSSSSFGSSSRRVGNRNSNDIGSSQLLLQRGLTRPRRSSSTAASNNNHNSSGNNSNGSSNSMLGHHHMSSSSTMPVLPPIINENQQLLSPAMVPSPPPFGGSRLSRQDSGTNTRDSPGSDSYSRDSYNDSHASSHDMEDIEDEETEFNRLRAAKRRSGNNAFFGMSTN